MEFMASCHWLIVHLTVYTAPHKAKEKYYTECAKMINLQNQLETCMAGREYERIKQKHEKSRHEVKTSGRCTFLIHRQARSQARSQRKD
jgi:hypothetical protein